MNATTRFGIAFAVTLLMGGTLAAAVEHAWFPVRPRLLCVMPLGTGDHMAHLGYVNETDAAISLPPGDDNGFGPSALTGTPVGVFEPGPVGTAEAPAFVVTFSGGAMTWDLGPRTLEIIAADAPECPIQKLASPPPDLAMLLPPPPPPPPEPPQEPPPEPPPEPPKAEPPPDPPKAEPPKPPKERPKRPRPKSDDKPPPAETAKPDEPIALQLTGLTNLSGGTSINSGDRDSLGSAAVAPTESNTRPPPPPREGVKDGVDEPAPRAPVRKEARVLSSPKGVWPEDAPPRAGAVMVRLSLRVGVDGRVKEVRVIKKAGDAFDRAAKAVGMKVVFSPATVDGEPVEVWVPWTVEFAPVDW